ncbi:trans-aconitate 2-methyltransferase [Paenarthrobacter nicotinovorans]|uniref:trans-aconitate 2-methyltransferase n=1 Tax=Paenarthrobacter nicotinovorans TaxID=29320 RepID=UPI0009A7E6DB|nr:trans-aconitate 2-methyltransferase [Paenarthrobacter nicotinovorans]MDI2019677.1 putative trans-aconitate 2-methyltransferase [Paenarthrobacter nicotinovorans]SKB63724.1 trans-aconitate 2-methyltransferase [Arthrobacter sp. 31Cvi3.1E]
MKWNPSKYAEFGSHRDRPFHDLVARIQAAKPGHVVDLGCGPGNMTATLADRWPAAHVVGIDSSQEMLAKAASLTGHYSGLSFNQGDIAEWMPDNDVDVVVTNAALQWVPGHQEMLAAWLEALRPGAWFALQVPGNFSSPSHALMRELAGSPRWRTRLDGVLRHDDAVGSPADYLGIMLDAGCSADAWETTYQQVLTGEDPVLEWVRGTGLRPVLSALPAPEADAFEKEYAAMLRQAYPSTAHGTVFPFRRIFAVARKHA